jgi:hypothetical protein
MQVSENASRYIVASAFQRLNRVAANYKPNEHMDAVGRVPGKGKPEDISQGVQRVKSRHWHRDDRKYQSNQTSGIFKTQRRQNYQQDIRRLGDRDPAVGKKQRPWLSNESPKSPDKLRLMHCVTVLEY